MGRLPRCRRERALLPAEGKERRRTPSSPSSTSRRCRARAIGSARRGLASGGKCSIPTPEYSAGASFPRRRRRRGIPAPLHGRSFSLSIDLPPLAALFLRPDPEPPPREARGEARPKSRRARDGARRGFAVRPLKNPRCRKSASTGTSTNRRARTRGSRRRGPGLGVPLPRLERAHHGGVLRAQRRAPASSTRRSGSSRSSTTTRGSASTSGRRCSPGSRRTRRTCTRRFCDADRESRDRFSGHGSALAQAYNHVILPLANARDRRNAGALGDRGLSQPLRPGAGGDVAARDGRGPREPRVDRGRARHPIHVLAPHQARAHREIGANGVERGRARRHRPDARLPRAAALRALDRRLLLRRRDRARRRLRRSPSQRPAARRAPLARAHSPRRKIGRAS